MIGRREMLTLIFCLPGIELLTQEGAMPPDDLPILSAADSQTDLTAKLERLLGGQPLARIAALLRQGGARDPGLLDLAGPEPDRGRGLDLGDGIRMGDPVLAVTFGLRRGWLRPDRRVMLELDHDGSHITGLRRLRFMAK